MRSGRELFSKYRLIVRGVTAVASVMPKKLNNFIWSASSGYDGMLAVGIRYCLLKAMAAKCGKNVYIGKYVTVNHCEGLMIGDNVSIHACCYVDAVGGVRIGNDVSIAHQVSVVSFEHGYSDCKLPIKYNAIVAAPVEIGDDVWIGCGARILSGVKISSRSIVAAGAVVTRNVDPFTIVGGVPAVKISSIPDTHG
jgi:acetyltransferase-like isoleucine patch superfamily enzyme